MDGLQGFNRLMTAVMGVVKERGGDDFLAGCPAVVTLYDMYARYAGEVMEDLKRVRLAGYEPYFDFERNPLEYYSNYTLATRQPMGFLDTLHCRGSFEDWCGLVNEVFDAACRYHCNGRGSAFIFAEAKYLQRQFQAVADVARAVLARGGSAAEVRCDAVEEPAEEGVKVFEVEKTRLSGEETRKCKLVLDELAKWSVAKALNAYFERVPRANTFVGPRRGADA